MRLVSDQLELATIALLSHRNADGGVEATKSGDSSGCWTTASALWSIISTGELSSAGIGPIRSMVVFLLDHQSSAADDAGSWPMLPGAAGCTMATGHAISALVLSKGVFREETGLLAAIDAAIGRGLQWLVRWQNPDGGWGPEPSSGGAARDSLVLSTHYAVMSFWMGDKVLEQYSGVRDQAVKYIKSTRNTDGSWGLKKGASGTVSDTARGVVTLLSCKASKRDEKIILDALEYIVEQRSPEGLWPLTRVELLFPKASAVFYYTNNSVVDALIAIGLATPDDSRARAAAKEGLKWLSGSQEASTGICYVSSPHDSPNKNMYTWPTAEWMHAVSAIMNAVPWLVQETAPAPRRTIWRRVTLGLGAPLLFVAGALIGQAWSGLAKDTKEFVTITILLSVGLNILAAFMFESIKDWLGKVRK